MNTVDEIYMAILDDSEVPCVEALMHDLAPLVFLMEGGAVLEGKMLRWHEAVTQSLLTALSGLQSFVDDGPAWTLYLKVRTAVEGA